MKKSLVLAMFLILAVVLTSPFSVSAKTKAGAKPGSFFYFFDKAFERTSLFFIFNPEKKAKKTLEYAEERLAEAEELKKEKEEKGILEIKKEETKETETSEKEIEKTDEKLKEEKSEEKTEVIKNKEETIKKDEQTQEIEKLKKEIEALKQKTSQIKVVEKIIEKPVVIEKTQNSSSQTSSQAKQKEVTLPNGAVVEMDENWNVVRTIKEASKQTYTPQITNNTTSLSVSVGDIKITSSSAHIEWKTNIPTDSKFFLTDPDGTPHVYTSLSGFSTSHFVNMTLAPGLTFSYEIEAIANGISTKKNGSFLTKSLPIDFTVSIEGNGNETKLYITSNQKITSSSIKIIKGEWATNLWDQRFGKGWDCDDSRQACLEYKNSINETFSQLQFCESCGSSDKPFVYRFSLATPLENFVETPLNPNETKSFIFRVQLTDSGGDSKQSTSKTCRIFHSDIAPEEFFARNGQRLESVQDKCLY